MVAPSLVLFDSGVWHSVPSAATGMGRQILGDTGLPVLRVSIPTNLAQQAFLSHGVVTGLNFVLFDPHHVVPATRENRVDLAGGRRRYRRVSRSLLVESLVLDAAGTH